LKEDSERRILDFLNRQEGKRARSKAIEEGTGLRSTCYPHLKRFEKEKILDVERTRGATVYSLTRKGENLLQKFMPPEIRGARKFYEQLTRLVDMGDPPEQFIRNIVPAIGITIVPVLLESIEKKQGILLEPMINDFKYFVMKYVAYRRYPRVYDGVTKDSREEVQRLNDLLNQLDDQPSLYKQELTKLQTETDALQSKLLSEGFSQ
jgi:DNA-binding PadR family transcriptional regulator